MRSEQEMFDIILGVARGDERVRAVYMNGSRANPSIKKDCFQDFDIVYVVTETGSFLSRRDWLAPFGEPAMVQEPDSNDFGWGQNADFSRRYAWLMLFKDGNRIDLTIETVENMSEVYLQDKLTVALLDKDGILPSIPPPSDEDYHVKKPSHTQYLGCCNEFWWCLNNVAKGIARDELPYAMSMFDGPVRDMLMKMLEWRMGIDTDFSVSAGKDGKFFKKLLSAERYERYAKTYSSGNYEELWEAVFVACDLFRQTAQEVGDCLEYWYNNADDENMMEYLRRLRGL